MLIETLLAKALNKNWGEHDGHHYAYNERTKARETAGSGVVLS